MEEPSLIILEGGIGISSLSELNTNGHCLLCLCQVEQTGSFLSSGVNTNPRVVTSLRSVFCYLTGSPHHRCQQEEGAQEDEISSSSCQDILNLFGNHHLPPLCVDCYGKLAEMHELHQQLVEIQRRIQEKTEIVRECVRKTTTTMHGECRTSRDSFMESLCNSVMSLQQMSKVSSFIFETHERIISKVSTPTLFPSTISNLENDDEDQEQEETIIIHTHDSLLDSLDVMTTTMDNLARPSVTAESLRSSTSKHKDNSISCSSFDTKSVIMELGTDVKAEHSISSDNDDSDAPSVSATDMDDDNFEDFGQTITMELPTQQNNNQCNVITETFITEDSSQPSLSTATGVNVCGVPVDPTANYVMIKTNVTDPETGAVTLQPVLLNVAQLQAQAPATTFPPTTASATQPTELPRVCPSVRYNKKQPKDQITIEKSNAYEIYEKELRLQPCEICNEKIPQGSHGSTHLGCHVGSENVIYCKTCEYSFISPFRSLEFHKSRHLSCTPDSTPIFKCDACDFQADLMYTLRKHLGEHERDPLLLTEYSCPLCPLKFKSKKSVQLHLGDKHVFAAKFSGRQTCDICKSYFQFSEIESHLWVHGIQEPLRCRMCMSMFSSLDAMIKHQGSAKHKGLHEKVCHICESITKFMSLTSLRQHYFDFHGLGTQFICEVCSSEFLSKEKWQIHMERLHSDKLPQKTNDGSVPSSSSSTPSDISIIDIKKLLQQPRRQKKTKKSNSSPQMIQYPDCLHVKLPVPQLLKHRIEKHNHPPLKCKCEVPYCESKDTFTSERDLKLHVAVKHQGYTILKKKAVPISARLLVVGGFSQVGLLYKLTKSVIRMKGRFSAGSAIASTRANLP